MSAMSDYLEEKLLNHVLRNTAYTPATTVYVGLSTGSFGDDNSGTELSGNGYARQSIAFDAASGGVSDNTAAVDFPAATGSQGTITHFGLFDASSGGMATLEELDAFGNMDSLDSFGTLEQLDNLVLHSASGAVSIAVTTTGGATRIQQASGTPSIAITSTSTSNIVLSAVGSATISITESSAATRIRTTSSMEDVTISISATASTPNMVLDGSGNVTISISAESGSGLIIEMSAGETITLSAGTVGEILGEAWTVIPPGDETWSTLQ